MFDNRSTCLLATTVTRVLKQQTLWLCQTLHCRQLIVHYCYQYNCRRFCLFICFTDFNLKLRTRLLDRVRRTQKLRFHPPPTPPPPSPPTGNPEPSQSSPCRPFPCQKVCSAGSDSFGELSQKGGSSESELFIQTHLIALHQKVQKARIQAGCRMTSNNQRGSTLPWTSYVLALRAGKGLILGQVRVYMQY